MDISTAFGQAFATPLALGAPSPESNPDLTNNSRSEQVFARRTSPESVYVFEISIERDDCHLLGVFLLVFIVSLMLSGKSR